MSARRTAVLAKADGIPATDVAALDAPAASSPSFAQKLAAIERSGFKVVPDSSLAARGEFAPGRFTYNPETLTRLDFAHEWRHFKQIGRLQERGIPWTGKTIRLVEGPAELGAYGWESRLWTRSGLTPTAEYVEWHAARVASYDRAMVSFRSLAAKPYGAKYRGIDW